MSIFVVLLVIVIIGFILFLVERFVPMPPVIKYILYAVIVIALLIWLLQGFGLISTGSFRVH